MKRMILVLLLALPAIAPHAADVPASLVGRWEIDVERSKEEPILADGDRLPARAAFHLVTLDITTNAFSIVAPYTEMRITGQTNIACVATASAPAQATFRKAYQNGISVEYLLEARGTNSIQLVSASGKLKFLTAYIWKRRTVEQTPAGDRLKAPPEE